MSGEKIDLDKLERKARRVAATGHGKAATPQEALALIARIRELEADVAAGDERLAGVLDGTFAVGDGSAQREIERLHAENCRQADRIRELEAAHRVLLEKGVVLP